MASKGKNKKAAPTRPGPVFTATRTESALIRRIVKRAMKLELAYTDSTDLSLDIEATHCNGTPLDLQRLLDAPDPDFGHDIGGIQRYIDRTTGKLTDFFEPRTAARTL